jgi:antitoxin component of RelBE/YafQ-DinJ toxin-antitoxin module
LEALHEQARSGRARRRVQFNQRIDSELKARFTSVVSRLNVQASDYLEAVLADALDESESVIQQAGSPTSVRHTKKQP